MAGHVSSIEVLNNIHITDTGAMTLSGVSNSAMKRTNETYICREPTLCRKAEYFTQILLKNFTS